MGCHRWRLVVDVVGLAHAADELPLGPTSERILQLRARDPSDVLAGLARAVAGASLAPDERAWLA